MDITPDYADDEDPLSLKSDLSCPCVSSSWGPGRSGKDRHRPGSAECLPPLSGRPAPERMPILQDLYEELLRQPEPEARRVASALELYCTGSLNLFNHRTNVEVNNRLLCYDIKALGKMLKKIGLLILTDQVWGRVTANRTSTGRPGCTRTNFICFCPIRRRRLTASRFSAVSANGGYPQRDYPKREKPVGEQ